MIITPLEDGTFKLEIPKWQIKIFKSLTQELNPIISDRSNNLTSRLFPTAYQADTSANNEYELLTHKDLLQSHLDSLEALDELSSNAELSEETLIKIIQGVNILRLVLGTRLEINGNDTNSPMANEDHPDHNLWLTFHLLGEILSIIVDVISE
jgi:hypothetical protein